MDEQPTGNENVKPIVRSGSFRKRPLEASGCEDLSSELDMDPISGKGSDVMEFSPSNQIAGASTVLDEIELHFRRSLSKSNSKRKQLDENEDLFKGMPSNPQFQGIQQRDNDFDDDVSSASSSRKIGDSKLRSLGNTTVPALVSSVIERSERSESCTVAVNDREQEVPEPIGVHQMPRLSSARSTSSGMFGSRSQAVSLVLQQNPQVSPKTTVVNNETVKVVPSTILSPRILSGASSSASSKVGMPTTTQSGTVKVIDLTRHCFSDTHSSKNGVADATPNSQQHRSLSLDTSSQDVVLNSLGTISTTNEISRDCAPTVSRSDSSSVSTRGTTPVGSPVILLPAAPSGVRSTMMMSSQPYILVNPTEVPRVNTGPLISTSNIFSGDGAKMVPGVLANSGSGGAGYLLLSPSHTNSVLQIVSTGIPVPSTVTSQQYTLISAPKQQVKSSNSTKVSCTSFVSDNKKDDINVMPASVEDHFAKALGDQWSKLNSGSCSNVSPSNTVKS